MPRSDVALVVDIPPCCFGPTNRGNALLTFVNLSTPWQNEVEFANIQRGNFDMRLARGRSKDDGG